MRTLFTLIAALLSLASINAANPQAADLLRQAAGKLRQAKSVSATCAIASEGHNTQARITMAGQRFRIESPGYAAWFDGRTQWTYSASTGEVTVTEPTAAELAETNPLSVIETVNTDYASTLLASGKEIRKIALKAKKPDTDVKSAVVTINARTLMPVSIDLTYASGQSVAVTVQTISTGNALPSSTFTFNKAHYPDAVVNDLR